MPPAYVAGLRKIGTMPVDINLLLAIDIIWVGSRLPEGGSLSVLPAG
ncbi:hypothetical protein G9X64_11540 [Rhizobium sophorae]|uniref:Uncharacterized protein n=1 Tax=Rhizobium sophorae TaxID=1535242 RepID=A0A7Y3WET0_9HYPH|nr:hypothetical protein [Rhizobium sophorae]MBX4864937.1 hypothetical protein [Rhizobium bangladeshense]NNU37107.1 hypothetical protein [Rhizobium sophorae]